MDNLFIYVLQPLYSSPKTVRLIKLRRVSAAWHVAFMGDRRSLFQGFGGET